MKRSTLNSFGFGEDELFLSAEFMETIEPYRNMTVGGIPILDYAYDIYEAIKDGRINKRTNIIAFVRGIQNNTLKVESKKQKKIKYLVTCTEDSDEGRDGINQDSIPAKEDKYADFNDSEELVWAINKIKSLKMELCIDFGVDLESVIKKALIGFKPAIEILTKLCDEVDLISELVSIVLTSGIPINELFPEDARNVLRA